MEVELGLGLLSQDGARQTNAVILIVENWLASRRNNRNRDERHALAVVAEIVFRARR